MNSRKITNFKYNWKFSRENANGFEDPYFDDTSWNTVRVPHDWAISGPFNINNDICIGRILEDGDEFDKTHTGRTGGLPHVGSGYYRYKFNVLKEDKNKTFHIEFDGIMSNSEVYINGIYIGGWPYGYTSFYLDLTKHIIYGEENTLCIKATNRWNSSRWYPGAGIYRNVRLVTLNPKHINYNGINTVIEMTGSTSANLKVEIETTSLENESKDYKFKNILLDEKNNIITEKIELFYSDKNRIESKLSVENIERWDLDSPKLYILKSIILLHDEIIDQVITNIGFRDFKFDKNSGFFLNGRHQKIKGVCMHHDLGALGTAVNVRAIERQLEILKSFGTNALRTSHNPPTPELLDLCDKMGILVMDEVFDEWREPKVKNGYASLWNDWAEKDLTALIKRDRNHPSIIMWSIGNEIKEQKQGDGGEIAKFLYNICKKLDPSRPVTCGFNSPDEAIENGLAEAVDIPGWNYKPHLYYKYHWLYPEFCMIGSETSSSVSSRGIYHFPAKMDVETLSSDGQISSYDLYAPPWGNIVETEFTMQKKHDFISGEFVWTGFDYLGEPTPFNEEWSSRSSYFGIVDLCGFPKDRFYLYAAEWDSKPVLHILPHWNWKGREGQNTPVFCITTYSSAELFVNGKSFGIRTKGEFSANNTDFTCDEGKVMQDEKAIYLKEHISDYRLIWDDIPYEPGEIKVVTFDSNGNYAQEKTVKTSGVAAKIHMDVDRDTIDSDGDDLSFITVSILDDNGTFVPTAINNIIFSIEGPGEIIAVDNGDPTGTLDFQGMEMKTFSGKCLVVIRSLKDIRGTVSLTAKSIGLDNSVIKINSIDKIEV